MDIKSPISEYSRITGRPTDTKAIERSIDLLLSCPIAYEFRTTLIKSLVSVDDITSIAKRIQGARLYILQKFISKKILNPQFKNKTTYSDTELAEIANTISPFVQTCMIR